MNSTQHERPGQVFSSKGLIGPAFHDAKVFAYPVQSGHTYQAGLGSGFSLGLGLAAAFDFSTFAFKALPVCGNDGLWLSAHLAQEDAVFRQVWTIYTEAFTSLERRKPEEQRRVMRDSRYRFSAILCEQSVVGVLAWWNLSGFIFVEHFAIASDQRSGGFGRRAMTLLQEHATGPVVVDVEPFGTDIQAARRVAFYERQGFAYCARSVTLPAYEGKPLAPSNLMAWRMTLDQTESERVLDTIAREIYNLPAAVRYSSAV